MCNNKGYFKNYSKNQLNFVKEKKHQLLFFWKLILISSEKTYICHYYSPELPTCQANSNYQHIKNIYAKPTLIRRRPTYSKHLSTKFSRPFEVWAYLLSSLILCKKSLIIFNSLTIKFISSYLFVDDVLVALFVDGFSFGAFCASLGVAVQATLHLRWEAKWWLLSGGSASRNRVVNLCFSLGELRWRLLSGPWLVGQIREASQLRMEQFFGSSPKSHRPVGLKMGFCYHCSLCRFRKAVGDAWSMVFER